MSDVVVLGEEIRVRGFALSGADVVTAETEQDAIEAWNGLGDDIKLVIVTPAVAEALGQDVLDSGTSLVAVIPE